MLYDELRSICRDITFGDWRIVAHRGSYLRVRVEFDAVDNWSNDDEPKLLPQAGRWWHIPTEATRSDVVRTVWAAVLMAVEHETRERFKYCDVAVFDPHFDIEAMADLQA